MQLLHRKPVSHKQKVLQHLKKCGKYGAYSYELAKPNLGGLCWHRRITDLRKEGFVIDGIQVKNGIWKYFLDLENSHA